MIGIIVPLAFIFIEDLLVDSLMNQQPIKKGGNTSVHGKAKNHGALLGSKPGILKKS